MLQRDHWCVFHLVILSLLTIVAGKTASALLTLGIAARYAFCTNLLNTNNPRSYSSKRDEIAKSLYALYYLDRTYGSSLNTIHAMPVQNSLPQLSPNVSQPKMPASFNQRPDDDDDEPLMKVQDDGIITYVFKLLSIWGDLTTRLKRMRTDPQEKGWESTSAYQQTRAQVFELERTYPQKHRFDWLGIEDRTAEDMAADRQYWDPWILSQMLIHGVQALLNHPVLHFFRRTDQTVRPPSFQQQIVDHSILHSRWIVRLIELCQEKNFQISDPFVGHMVASTATVLFFLSFSKDEQLATKAMENFDKCEQFVAELGQKWPHLLHTVNILNPSFHQCVDCADVYTESQAYQTRRNPPPFRAKKRDQQTAESERSPNMESTRLCRIFIS